jgi:Cu/Ag efflux pump CusA
MMRWIVDTSIGLRFLVIVIAVALMTFGLTQLQDMPIDVFPEFDPPLVEVQTEALGLSAAEMEALITVPLEADLLNGVAWLDQIYSESVVGLSSILLVFEPGTDPIRARQMVQERLTQTFALPNVSKPPTMLQPLSTTSRVMLVGLTSDEVPLIDMGVLARWVIKPRLMGVSGVANVAIWGQREWQMQVQVDPEQLQQRGVTLQQVIETTGEALWVSPLSYLESSTPGTAGWIDTPNQRLSLRHVLPISSAQDLAKVPVKGTAWRLGEVAQVVEDRQPLIGDAILDEGSGLLLVIEKFPGANTLEVTRGVEEALEAMRPGLAGITIDTSIFRPANYLMRATFNLAKTLLIGGALGILALLVLRGDWRTVLISLVAVTASLVVAALILYLRGATFNIVVLTGLMVALGLVVDDSLIGVDNLIRRLRETNRDDGEGSFARIISDAVVEIYSDVGFVTLMVLLAVLPAFFLQGLTGSFFRPLVVSFVIAVLSSLGVALIITPALAMLLLPAGSMSLGRSSVGLWLEGRYGRILERMVRSPRSILVLAFGLLILAVILAPLLEISMLPRLKQTDLNIHWEAPPATSRKEMNRMTSRVSQELRSLPGVLNVGSHVGRAITGDEVVGIHSGEIWLSLDQEADYDDTLAAVHEVISGYPGFIRELRLYLPERIGQALTRPEQDIVVRIYGHEFDVLREKAEQVKRAMSRIDGIIDLEVASIAERPEVEIEVNLAAAERYQVKPGDVRRSAATLLAGLQVGNLYEEQKVFDVIVWGVPEARQSLSDIRNLLIDTPRGGHVRLGEVADVRISPTPIVIQRDAVSRFIDVAADVSGRSPREAAKEVENALLVIDFPIEYHAELIGESAGSNAGTQHLILISIISGVGIFLLLQAAFDHWRLAIVFMLVLPFALAGGVLSAFLIDGVISFGSLFGFLAVFGISLRQGVVMTRHMQQIEREERGARRLDLVLRGARERLIPVLMTAVFVGLLVVPVVLAGDEAGNEVLRPIAVVVLGGLITSMHINLLLMPYLYLRFGGTHEEERSGFGADSRRRLSSSVH